ncbi:PilN domain-containing protein [Halomonas sp. Bachu 37]|uniref:PilN domain-containing protein n=1 Tax=Halomonas kashgarensis TaxID=3084920 RepID=UPI00321626E2
MNVNINLLPWREARREKRTRRFHLCVALAVMVGCAVGFGVARSYQTSLDAQQQRNAYIQRQIDALNDDVQAIQGYSADVEQLSEQVAVFNSLQTGRSRTVGLFNDLAGSLAEGVHYLNLSRRAEMLEGTGIASSNRQVSDQLRGLAAAPGLEVPMLSEVEEEAERGGRRFRFTVLETPPLQRAEPGLADTEVAE